MADIVVRGGTVVTAGVATGGRGGPGRVIEAIEPDLGGPAARRPTRSSTRPGCSCCRASSTSTPTPAWRPTPSPTASSRTRSRRRSAGRRRSSRSTTRAPGSSPAADRSLLAGIDEFRRVTANDSAVDYAVTPGDPRRHGRPARRAAGDGRRRRPDREGVHGLRLPAGRPARSSRRCGSSVSGAGCSRSTARIRS